MLAARTDWGFSGRVAYSQAGQGGSARIDWRQTGPVLARTLPPVARFMGTQLVRETAALDA